ncbi:Ig-like domain-containing protein [Budvicia aquatica]|uniref:Bacterial Ig-like domain (Group 2) n=1 Tax=Budvicia aquatica TaxID=82979 RepID=A0A484ZUD4_9GAMM|nr:Ig-like domain-containing protein [Budvicia aquatica]VFS51401.1 Bacterial Ig-like domain (group 2) [Budvicia aquatica]
MPAPVPANIALMYIVKTDGGEPIPPVPTPTNIIITPSSLNLGVGQTRSFSAQVMPSDLAAQYPVSWISTNTAVGTIHSSTGLFNGIGSGETDVIATISSGLSVSVRVRVDILLTSILLADIPNQTVGDNYQLQVTKTPSNATEILTYASTNNAVANVLETGALVSGGGELRLYPLRDCYLVRHPAKQ